MRNEVLLRGLALILAASGLFGCSEEDPTPIFPKGTGQLPNGTAPYAPGPYGISKGSTVENFEFVGFANAMEYMNTMQVIQLADFYNPTGTDVYPPGSQYGEGKPKPKALLIDVASVWCGPCNIEAGTVLPDLYAQYHPQGGEFLLALADGPDQGVPATPDNLTNWTKKYHVNYPASIDPASKLGALFESDSFPTNILVRTRDMSIVQVIAGAPEPGSSFWKTFEKVLAE
jgi:hypothetical protein